MPPVSLYLEKHRIACAPQFDASQVPTDCDLVLVNSYYGAGNPEVDVALARGLPVTHFPRFLSDKYLAKSRNAVVAGSYGKTTTASMLAWILLRSGKDPGWLVGGACGNLGECLRPRNGGIWVVEGDEYPCGFEDPAPKFRYYNPAVGILTALDHVHQDIFGTFEEMIDLFRGFLRSVKEVAFVAEGVRLGLDTLCDLKCGIETVGFTPEASRCITKRRWDDGWNRFHFLGQEFSVPLRGAHSCVNAALAASAAEVFGVSAGDSAAALREFSGVDSRQEVFIKNEKLVLIHDSAIYPRSIARVVEGVRESAPSRRLCVLFHPRNTLGDSEKYHSDLAEAFSCVDFLLVADAVNLPGVRFSFEFELEKLKTFLPSAVQVAAIGPAMKCFEQWRESVEPRDAWLILVEPIFPEPTSSMRAYCHNVGNISGK
jgi:UDP-N-acetylmuramate: L-alanyl-gamma-D-glutamyl-meso-diaminopimelate ligase